MPDRLSEHMWSTARLNHPPAIKLDGTLLFLEGVAWDHPEITFAIERDALVDPEMALVIRRAAENWTRAIADSPHSRLRDFRLSPAPGDAAADIVVRLLVEPIDVDGFTELSSRPDGSIERVVITVSGHALGPEPRVDVVATIAVRCFGHALGLGFAANPEDPMYPAFNGVKLWPSRADIEAFATVEGWYVNQSPFFYPPPVNGLHTHGLH